MEELRKLEQVQKTLKLMQSHGLIDSSAKNNADDSNRFLANFILLLIQPCGTLDIDRKCQLISDHFPKISAAFLEEALLWLCDEGNNRTENPVPLECDDEAGVGSLRTYSEDMAMVGFDSMQRANSTLEDFCRSYFMFHEMDANKVQSVFRYLPLLSFAESYIYQLDSFNEKVLQLPISGVPDFDGGSAWGPSRNWILKFMKLFRTDPFGPLAVLLEHHGLLTERIKEEFKCGEEYWSLERKLCRALTGKKEIPVEDVMRAIHLKSFDFRVLNLLLYQLRGEKINEVHMEFLSISEFLVEVSDDFVRLGLLTSSVT